MRFKKIAVHDLNDSLPPLSCSSPSKHLNNCDIIAANYTCLRDTGKKEKTKTTSVEKSALVHAPSLPSPCPSSRSHSSTVSRQLHHDKRTTPHHSAHVHPPANAYILMVSWKYRAERHYRKEQLDGEEGVVEKRERDPNAIYSIAPFFSERS